MKAIELHGMAENGKMLLSKPQIELRQQYLISCEGKPVTMKLSRTRTSKTHQQVKNHFGNAIRRIVDECEHRGLDASIVYNTDKPTGVPVDVEMLQKFFYTIFPTCNDEGKLITMSDFNTEQCSDFFEKIRNWAASQWSIVIPDPDPEWRTAGAKNGNTMV